ncbi:hypothetical protein DMP14_24465 [Pseudonocardia sp. Ae707_Ps2]
MAASSPATPWARDVMATPMTMTSANAGFIRTAAISQRTTRQNIGAVVSAIRQAAAMGMVAIRTMIAAVRKIMARAKPTAAGMIPNRAVMPSTIERTLSSISAPRSGLSPNRAATAWLSRIAVKLPYSPSHDRNIVVSPSAPVSSTATAPVVTARAMPNWAGPVTARIMPRPPRTATMVSW